MKKQSRLITLFVLALLALVLSVSAAFASAAPQPVNFGQDANKMQQPGQQPARKAKTPRSKKQVTK